MELFSHAPTPFKDFLKTAAPAVAMPLVFTVIPGFITGDDVLLRLSWSVITPSSLAGALAVVYIRPFTAWLNRQLTRSPKIAVAGFGGALVALVAMILGAFASRIGELPNGLANDIAMSAGIGALAAILTAFPIHKS